MIKQFKERIILYLVLNTNIWGNLLVDCKRNEWVHVICKNWVTFYGMYILVAGEQEVNILAEILDNSADVFEDLAKEIGSEDIVGK